MKKLLLISFLALCYVCSARADLVTAIIVVTNTAGTTNGQNYVVNGDTRTWTNSVVIPASQIFTNNTRAGAANNMLSQAALNPFTGLQLGNPAFGISLRTTNAALLPLTVTISPGWATLTMTTNLSGTNIVLRTPVESEAPGVRTNEMSNVAQALKYSTNTVQAPGFSAFGVGVTNRFNSTTYTNPEVINGHFLKQRTPDGLVVTSDDASMLNGLQSTNIQRFFFTYPSATNALPLNGEGWFFVSSTQGVGITNVTGLTNGMDPWARLVVSNSAASAVTGWVTIAGVRIVGPSSTNALVIAAGKIGEFTLRAINTNLIWMEDWAEQ